MELEEFKAIWSEYDKKLDRTLQCNAALVRSLTLGKVESALWRHKLVLFAETLVGFLFAGFLLDLGYHSWQEWDILIAVGVLLALTLGGLVGCIRQIQLVEDIDYAAPIPVLQKNLMSIRSHNLAFAKFALLSLPLFLAYIVVMFKALWGINIVVIAEPAWIWMQIIGGIACLPLVFWLWSKVSPSNVHIGWVSSVIQAIGGEQLARAMNLLNEVMTFEKESSL